MEYFMFKKILFLSLITFSCNSFAENNEDNSELIAKLALVVTDLCHSPSTEGKYWKVEANGDVGASIRIFGELNGDIHFTDEEWEGVRYLRSEDQVDRENGYRTCIQQMTPMLLEKMTKQESAASGPRVCTQNQYDRIQYLSDKFSDEHVNSKYNGGREIISEISSCTYNSYSKKYNADLSITWKGQIFKSNVYNLSGKLEINDDGEYEFSRTYANKTLEEFETTRMMIAIPVAIGVLANESSKKKN